MAQGWVASDATSHVLVDTNFQPRSLVSVAIAVDDRSTFNTEYRQIVREKCQEFGMLFERPVIKDRAINKFTSEWNREAVRRSIVESLLQIDSIANVHFTETTLGQPGDRVVPAYQTEPNEKRLLSPSNLLDQISPYYNLVSIWDYFDRIDSRFQHTNVMVDDFDGKESLLWHEIGDYADDLLVVPKGDRIYPLLSLADLTMEYVKQEVEDWSDEDILDLLVDVTPGDSAFVEAASLDEPDKLRAIAPLSTKSADTQIHYPHPVVYVDTGEWHQKEVQDLDLYDILCEYVYTNGGCLKFFDERQDRGYMRDEDYIVCMDTGTAEEYRQFDELNNNRSVTVLESSEAMDAFADVATGD